MENEILLCLKENVPFLALGQILQLLWMKMRFSLIGSNENASCRHVGERYVWAACAINQGWSKLEMHELGLEEKTYNISLRVVYPNQSSSP